jgi:microcystin-dependent protein
MSSPYIGEIRLFGGNFAPVSWAFCNGQLMAISQNEALFTLVGTFYGGDGTNTFALPNLQGRMPVHQGTDTQGNNYVIGQLAGTESVTLTTQQIPQHTHLPAADGSAASAVSPTNAVWGTTPANNEKAYSSNAPTLQMNSGALSTVGGSQPHENMSPYLAVSFIIALEGIFPTQG